MSVTFDKPKPEHRKPVHWWQHKPMALCPQCDIPCVAVSTAQSSESYRTQYRRCPQCGYTMKTIIEG